MVWAAENGYVILSADLDFGAMLAPFKGLGPSIIQIRSDNLSPNAIGSAVINALRQTKQELTEGALVSLDAVRARLRILPLT